MWGRSSAAPGAQRGEGRVEAAALPADADARAAIKAYLRIESGTEDALVDRLATAATGHCEGFIGRMAIIRQVVETMPVQRCWLRLATSPVRAVTGVAALDPAGVATVLAAAAYGVDIDAAGDGWLCVTGAGEALVARVTYTAGLAGGFAGLPEPIAQGIVRLAAHLFTVRDAADEGAPPAAVAALWRPWRRMRLA